jgi:hypothetical protein
MRLSLMSEDQEISRFLLNKAIELMGRANEAKSPDRPNLRVVQQQQQTQREDE